MATTSSSTTHGTPFLQPPPAIPPLEPGDHLSRDEFERRWEAMPDLKHAELLDGVVYMNAAVSLRHGMPHSSFHVWAAMYAAHTPGIDAIIEPSVRFDERSMPQPDVVLMTKPEHGGQAKIIDDYITGAPELVAEISTTTASKDLHLKLDVYRRFGVREYIVWRTYDQAIDWFILRGDRFDPLSPEPGGVLKSVIYPGLWLDVPAILRGETLVVLNHLQQGLATPEHAAFAKALASAAKPAS
jgi:Uma2 family endonuclease